MQEIDVWWMQHFGITFYLPTPLIARTCKHREGTRFVTTGGCGGFPTCPPPTPQPERSPFRVPVCVHVSRLSLAAFLSFLISLLRRPHYALGATPEIADEAFWDVRQIRATPLPTPTPPRSIERAGVEADGRCQWQWPFVAGGAPLLTSKPSCRRHSQPPQPSRRCPPPRSQRRHQSQSQPTDY